MPVRASTFIATGIALFAGCAVPVESPLPSTFSVAGELVGPPGFDLPADARAIAELRVVNDPQAPVVAEQRIGLQGRQVPVAFQLVVDRARLKPGERYAVRGGVESRGRFAWVTDAVTVDASAARADAGALLLRPARPLAFSTVFNCGGHRAELGFSHSTMQLVIQEQTFALTQVQAASGTRHEAVDDATTSFWNQGARATLTVRGRTYPECVEAKVALPLRATGNEPSWRLDIAADAMTLLTDFGQTQYVTTAPVRTRTDDMTRFAGRAGTAELAAVVADRLCTESMSGMPHPYVVTVRSGGRVWQGCGGEPRSLLTGREWVVEDLGGRGIIDRSRLTLVFDDTGQLSGRAGCNTYTGRYVLSGEALSVGETVASQTLCAASLMQQEARFLESLRSVSAFEFTADGALVLSGAGRRKILARL